MKRPAFKPGFEFIFSLSILAVLGLPPLVFAQSHTKDLQITISNGDTIINGKNIKELSGNERKDALKNIDQIATINTGDKNGTHSMVIVTRKRKGDKEASNNVVIEQNGQDDDMPVIADGDMHNGTKVRVMKLRIDKQKGNDSTFTLNYGYSMNSAPKHRMEVREFRMNRDEDRLTDFGRKNSQNFMYTNTDNNGISTHVSYHVSDHPATLDYDEGRPEKAQLDMLYITDLNIVPEFSAGKTILMFTLPSKAVAEVQLKDSKGNLLWSEKALNGSFNKSFALGLNGLYYLQVKQGSKIVVKQIMKD